MKCAVHADLDSTGFCRNCGKPLCSQCTREVRGVLYCEDCLAAIVAAPTLAKGASGGPNPGLACALGFIPGLGAVYNGEYLKALIHVLIFGGLIAAANSEAGDSFQALSGLLIAAFYFYMPIEAYRTALARHTGQPAPGFLGEGETNHPIGAYILIVLGALFLIGRLGWLASVWVSRLWPLALILLGVLIIWKRSRATT